MSSNQFAEAHFPRVTNCQSFNVDDIVRNLKTIKISDSCYGALGKQAFTRIFEKLSTLAKGRGHKTMGGEVL